MEHHQHVPWQLKIAAKVILARVPVSQRLLSKAGVFRTNAMENPRYAIGVFRRHFQHAIFARKDKSFVVLELGPGTSAASAVISRALGASESYAVDVTHFALDDIDHYRMLESYLRQEGLQPPSQSAPISTKSWVQRPLPLQRPHIPQDHPHSIG